MRTLKVTLSITPPVLQVSEAGSMNKSTQNNPETPVHNGENCISVSICVEYPHEQIEFLSQMSNQLLNSALKKIQFEIEKEERLAAFENNPASISRFY